jgi:hypothetical protein
MTFPRSIIPEKDKKHQKTHFQSWVEIYCSVHIDSVMGSVVYCYCLASVFNILIVKEFSLQYSVNILYPSLIISFSTLIYSNYSPYSQRPATMFDDELCEDDSILQICNIAEVKKRWMRTAAKRWPQSDLTASCSLSAAASNVSRRHSVGSKDRKRKS